MSLGEADISLLKMFEVTVNEALTARALACKKIKASDAEIRDTIKSIINYIRYFNSLAEFDSTIFDMKSFDQVMIPNEFSCFIIPKTVKYMPGLRQSVDLVVRDDVKLGNKTFAKWIDLCHKWRGFFKKDAMADVTALSSLRVDKALADVIDKGGFIHGKDSYVRYNSSPFIPIILQPDVWKIAFRDDYFNSDCGSIIEDYLTTIFF